MNRLARAFSALSFLALSIGGASGQTVLLPPGPLTSSTTPSLGVTLVDTPQTIQFTVTFNGLPAGLSIGNQSYLGWCPDYWGDFNQNTAATPYTPYSTDDVAHLPANAQSVNWPAVNWVLNNKPSGAESTWIVQQTIWRLLANQYAPADQGYPLPEPATDNLYNQALAQGSNFVPTAGQTIGVLLYIDGIDPIPAQNGLPSNGQANNFQEVMIEVPVGPGAIGDFVWQDTNQNGIQDAGEPGINGVTVQLCADSNCNTVIATTTTSTFRGNDGYYQFSGLPFGTYWISINGSQPALSGLVPTITGAGTPSTDSNVNPSVTTLTASQPQDETIDFGFTSPGTSAIGDFVWQDNNANGLQDSGEPGLPGLTVNLCADVNCNTILKTTTTDQNGYYHFTGLFAGTYFVQVVPGANFVATTSQVDFPDDSAIDSGGQVPGVPSEVNLPVNTIDNTIDFGFVPPAQGAIGDFVWHDANRNGIQDTAEPGIDNVTLRLFNASNALVATTTTVSNNGQDGYYQFTGLSAGTYTVVVDSTTLPPNFTPTTSNAPGSTTANDSNGSPAPVTLATNVSVDETIDFGYVSPCAGVIGDFVWLDANGNGIQDAGELGIQGVTVSLFDSNHVFLLSTVTDANGLYHFTGLCPATYTVQVTTPSGYQSTTPNAPGSTPDNDSNPSPATVTLANDATDDSIDFGFIQSLLVGHNQCPSNTSGEVGVPYNISPGSFTGGVAPFTYSIATGSLPAGLSLDPNTGIVSGTPTAAGSFTLQVTDALQNVVVFACPYTIVTGPSLACSSSSTGEVGAVFNGAAPTVSGGTGPFVFSVATGALPAGLTLNASTGAITGTPTAAGSFTLQVTDANNVTATGTCPYTIAAGPSLACSSSSTGEVGAIFTGSARTVSGGTAPFIFSVATGALPAGLTLNASTGAITGTPTATGTFTLQVTDANNVTATGTCPYTIGAAPSLACSSSSTGEVGAVFTGAAPTVSGGTAPFIFSVATGALPAGLTLNASTGAITGTPTATGTFTLQVTDANNVTATGTCPYTIGAAPSLACSSSSTGEVGAVFTGAAPTVSGGTAPFTFSVATGALPNGLSLNSSTGAITGTPTAAGTFTLKATDSLGSTATGTCPYTISAGPSLACSSSSTGEVGAVFNGSAATVSGGTAPFTFAVATGALPAGLTLNASTGAITGTPTAAGSFTLKVTDSLGSTATGTCPYTISAGPSLACSSSSTGEVGASFSSPALSVSGGTGPFIFSVATGALPTGLTLNASTGAITGTPTAAGTFTLKVTDANNVTATGTCPYTIAAGPSLACSSSSTGEVGAVFNGSAPTVSGGTGPFIFSVATGALPTGLTLNASTGAITGTPAAAGTFTLKVTDANNVTATGTCPYTISTGPSLACSSSSAGEVGAAFNSPALSVSGGTAPFTFAVATGALPAGLSLNASTGAITGTPTAAGTFTLKVTDSKGVTATGTCPYTIASGPSLACSSTSTGEVGASFSSPALSVTGGTAPFTFAVATGSLPTGLTLNTTTGAITGTPTAGGTFTLKVTDSKGATASGTCPYTIASGPSLACSSTSSGEVGVTFNSPAPTVTGGTAPYTFAIATGTLPAGLTLNKSTGAITGKPTAAGSFTLKVTDSKGATASSTCPYSIVTAPTTNCQAATVYKGVAITPITLTGSGGAGGPYTFTATGLPPGLTISSSGTISGTPTSTGTYNYVITIKDVNGNAGTVTCCSITVNTPTTPVCKVYDNGNPPYMTYQDTGVGIVKLIVTTNSNFNVGLSPVPSGTAYSPAVSSLPYPMPTGEVITFPATTGLLSVSATRINTSKSAQLTVEAVNAAGITVTCDPITTVVSSLSWQSGLSGVQTFTNIPQAADLIEITNGNPGLSDLLILVNGVPFLEYQMTNGQNLTVNVGKAMKAGNNNTIMLVGVGLSPGSTAAVDISQ